MSRPPVTVPIDSYGARRLAGALVRFCAGVAGMVGIGFAVAGAVTQDQDLIVRGVGPLVLSAVALAMIISNRERVLPLMAAAVVVVVIQVPSTSIATTETPAAVGLVVVGMAGALFVRRWYAAYFTVYASIIVGAQIWWQWPDRADALARSVGSLVALAFSSWLVLALRRSMTTGSDRYELLFSKAPISLWEEDFSAVVPWLAGLRAEGVTDLEAHLRNNPALLREAASRIVVKDVNDAAIRLVGARSRADLLGPLHPEPLTSTAARSLIPQLLAVWEGADSAVAEVRGGRTLRGKRLDGLLHWSAPRVNGRTDLTHVIVTVVDMTQIRESQEQLERLVRSKEELVASVSHEIRTPLTAIVGFAGELQNRASAMADDERDDLLRVITEQGHEIATIVDDLLTAARVEADGLAFAEEIVALRDEAKTVVEPFAFPIPITGNDDLTCVADPTRVRQIIRNLVSNAEKYGGRTIRIQLRRYASTAIVEVRDNGPALPSSEREAIFDRYYRARQTPGMTGSVGLGLHVSRMLARGMGGDLTYDHDGSEAIFRLTLPAT